jgi:hypothetical protein
VNEHKEQRRTATLYEQDIESYGVETSKNIRSLDLKVTYQTMIVNAFLDEFGIVAEHHNQYLAKPRLSYLLVSVNNQRPVAYKNGEVLNVNKGGSVRIEQAFTNYNRGVIADLENNTSLNDLGKSQKLKHGETISIKASDRLKLIDNNSTKTGVISSPKTSYSCAFRPTAKLTASKLSRASN